jgi:hypothetical protein
MLGGGGGVCKDFFVWRGICVGCMSDEKTDSKKSRQIESKNLVKLSF